MVAFSVSWYEWDGKDSEGQKTDGSLSKIKAAGFDVFQFTRSYSFI